MPTAPSANRSTSPKEGIGNRLIGSALLTNTTACEASRLFFSPTKDYDRGKAQKHYQPSVLRVSDLMLLIDSVILHEQVFYLPASLPDDADDLELRNNLVESGVLAPLPKGNDYNLVGQALLASLSTVDRRGWSSIAPGLVHRDKAGTGIESLPLDRPPRPFEDIRPWLMDELELTAATALPLNEYTYEFSRLASMSESFDDAVQILIQAIEYNRVL